MENEEKKFELQVRALQESSRGRPLSLAEAIMSPPAEKVENGSESDSSNKPMHQGGNDVGRMEQRKDKAAKKVRKRVRKRKRRVSSDEGRDEKITIDSDEILDLEDVEIRSEDEEFLDPRSTLSWEEVDFSKMELKKDHKIRPVWVLPTKRVMLEASSRFYQQAYDFLVAIAEPVTRPKFVHEYKLTSYSLYAAVSIGLTPESIIDVLDRLSKVELPTEVCNFILECTVNFGKAKLVLRDSKMFVESPFKSTLERLLRNPTIKGARIAGEFQETDAAQEEAWDLERLTNIDIREVEEDDPHIDNTDLQYLLQDKEEEPSSSSSSSALTNPGKVRKTDLEEVKKIVFNFQIENEAVEKVRKAALEIEFPLMEEYDFRNDKTSGTLSMELKPSTEIRPYQERSLSKMFGNGRARSGIIVLPCGAGKTLTGITACCTMEKSCIVLCTGGVAAQQWKKQLMQFTTVDSRKIFIFTSKEKNEIDGRAPCILITTYSMMAVTEARRSRHTKEVLESIWSREWGLMVLDEVHVTPAKYFRRVMTNVKAHCKLGLTATLVREDEKIGDLNFLIGPKLYEANWLDLTEAGYLAKVLCNEVRCPMTPEFFAEYLHESSAQVKQLLYTMNPNKCIVCDYLVRLHESRGDRVLVFCDNLMAVKFLSEVLKRDYICGATSMKERMQKYSKVRMSSVASTLILSKVGDVAIDLPEANVIIQVSSQFGSRRQEAQRLGRILRPKEDRREEYDAYFYTLISDDTDEMLYATKRQKYLVDQGYSYQVSRELSEVAKESIGLRTDARENSAAIEGLTKLPDQLNLLQRILVTSKSALDTKESNIDTKRKKKKVEVVEIEDEEESSDESGEEDEEEEDDGLAELLRSSRPLQPKRRKTDMNTLTGAGNLEYFEFSDDDAKKNLGIED